MNSTGHILVLAFPDTFVTMSEEFICKLLPLVGLGTRDYIKAGHAALVLIENKTGKAKYFDFGRYVTPKGHGRVRGANTDAELEIPFKAEISKDNELLNAQQFLLWLEANPSKTHGEGRLLGSVCHAIDYKKAAAYIYGLQEKGSIPYGAFDKLGSNCSRFVTDTLLAATSDSKIRKALQFNKKFTPSTVGNVEKAATLGEVFEVYNGIIQPFLGSAFKENLKNYFDKSRNASVPLLLDEQRIPESAQKLSGIGSNAWFLLTQESSLPMHHFRIRRYNEVGDIDFDGVFVSQVFDIKKPFQFTYDSHCKFCHVTQDQQKIKMDCVAKFGVFNSSQKVRSA